MLLRYLHRLTQEWTFSVLTVAGLLGFGYDIILPIFTINPPQGELAARLGLILFIVGFIGANFRIFTQYVDLQKIELEDGIHKLSIELVNGRSIEYILITSKGDDLLSKITQTNRKIDELQKGIESSRKFTLSPEQEIKNSTESIRKEISEINKDIQDLSNDRQYYTPRARAKLYIRIRNTSKSPIKILNVNCTIDLRNILDIYASSEQKYYFLDSTHVDFPITMLPAQELLLFTTCNFNEYISNPIQLASILAIAKKARRPKLAPSLISVETNVEHEGKRLKKTETLKVPIDTLFDEYVRYWQKQWIGLGIERKTTVPELISEQQELLIDIRREVEKLLDLSKEHCNIITTAGIVHSEKAK